MNDFGHTGNRDDEISEQKELKSWYEKILIRTKKKLGSVEEELSENRHLIMQVTEAMGEEGMKIIQERDPVLFREIMAERLPGKEAGSEKGGPFSFASGDPVQALRRPKPTQVHGIRQDDGKEEICNGREA